MGDSQRARGVRGWLMRPGITITSSLADRRRLKALVGDRNAAAKRRHQVLDSIH